MGKLLNFLKKNKEGAIIGAIAGFIIGKWFIPVDFDYSAVAQSFGFIDVLQSGVSGTIEFAKQKVLIGTTIIGATIGVIIDSMVREKWWRRL